MKKLILDSFLAGANFVFAIVFMKLGAPLWVLFSMAITGLLLFAIITRYESIKRGDVKP